MLPRPRRTSSGTSRLGRNAVTLHDHVAGPRLPFVRLVGRHADHAGKRPSLTVVDMHDIGMRARTMEDRPDRARGGDLDNLVLTDVTRELQVDRMTGPIDEVDAGAGEGLEPLRVESVILDDDLRHTLSVSRDRGDGARRHRQGQEPAHAHRYSSSTGFKVSDSPARQIVTPTVSSILCRASDSWN